MIAFVGDEIARIFRRRRKSDGGQVLFRFLQRGIERRRVALVGLVDRRRHDHARVEIDRMFGLVGKMRRAVLHLGDLRVRIGLARPIFVRQLLAFALAVEPDQVVDRRRLDTALLGHPRQHLAIALAIVAAHDRPQRGVGLHRRAVDADPLAFHQTMLGDELQDEGEHLLVHFVRQTAARLRQPGMIGNLVALAEPKEISQRSRIRAAPDNAALAVEPFEITDHVHAEITARRQRSERPSSAHNTACRSPRRKRRSRLQPKASGDRRKTRGLANAASPPNSS